MLIYEVLKIRDFSKLLRLLFATPQKLLREPLWGRDPLVGNHCSRRIDVADEAVINEFNCIEQVSGPIWIRLKKFVSGQIVYF